MADEIPLVEFQSQQHRSGFTWSGLHGDDVFTEVGDHLGLLAVGMVVAEPGNQGDSESVCHRAATRAPTRLLISFTLRLFELVLVGSRRTVQTEPHLALALVNILLEASGYIAVINKQTTKKTSLRLTFLKRNCLIISSAYVRNLFIDLESWRSWSISLETIANFI